MCDANCNQRSLVTLGKEIDGEVLVLDFCGHHFNKIRQPILLDGFIVLHDERPPGLIFESVGG